jgi:hypothetical protein
MPVVTKRVTQWSRWNTGVSVWNGFEGGEILAMGGGELLPDSCQLTRRMVPFRATIGHSECAGSLIE